MRVWRDSDGTWHVELSHAMWAAIAYLLVLVVFAGHVAFVVLPAWALWHGYTTGDWRPLVGVGIPLVGQTAWYRWRERTKESA